MRSACRVRTRFIPNNFSGIGFGDPRTPRTPLGCAPGPDEEKEMLQSEGFAENEGP